MKSKSYILTYVCALAVGILLLAFSNSTGLFSGIVLTIGILFIAASLIGGINALRIPAVYDERGRISSRHTLLKSSMLVPAAAGLIFGILLVSMPDFFARFIIYTFAAILILLGVAQLMLCSASRIGGWSLLVPGLTIAAGIACIIVGHENVDKTMAIITGIMLVAYAVDGFISLRRGARKREQERNRTLTYTEARSVAAGKEPGEESPGNTEQHAS